MAQQVFTNDILEVKFYSRMGSQGAINTRHYLVALTPLGGTHTDQDVATRFNVVFRPLFRALMSVDAAYVGCSVQIKTRNGFDPAYVTDTGAGLVATDALPPHCAGLIQLITGRAGRQNRGRMYVPFPGTGGCDVFGQPTAGYVTDLEALGTQLKEIQTVTVGGLNLGIVPVLYNPNVPPEVQIIGFHARSYFASMRSRSHFSAHNILPIG